jgi:hypothetical protein
MELSEGRHAAEGILSEANGKRSRGVSTIAASCTVLAMMLLGQIAEGDSGGGVQTVAAAVAYAGNTAGSGTVGSLTADAHAPAGRYNLVCIEPGTNAGKFEVTKPDGTVDGIATVAVAYNGTLNFTISDATDFVAGDGFYVDVSYADVSTAGQWKPWDPEATDGTQNAGAVAIYPVTTGAGETAEISVIKRDAEINKNVVSLPDDYDLDDAEVIAAFAQLEALGVIVR